MIDRSQISHASDKVIAKAKRCWIRKLDANTFRVRPRIKGKAIRRVVFIGSKVLCVDFRTGEECEGNSRGVVCYHAFKANEHRERLKRRNKRRAA